MHISFLKNAENDIDHDYRRQNQQWLGGQRRAKFRRGATEVCCDRIREPDLSLGFFDCRNCVAERATISQIKGNRRGGELSLMWNGKRRVADMHGGKRAQRYRLACARLNINLVEQIG